MNWYKRIPPAQNSFFWDRPHGRCSFNFRFCHFHLPGLERYSYLLGTWKLKCIDRNLIKSGTRTCLVQTIKWNLEFPKVGFQRNISNFAEWLNGSSLTRNIVEGFSIFGGKKKFYYRHSPKKCIKYSFDSRAYLKTERRLCFPTSDRLETWFLPSGPTLSRQFHESTMVWRNLPS